MPGIVLLSDVTWDYALVRPWLSDIDCSKRLDTCNVLAATIKGARASGLATAETAAPNVTAALRRLVLSVPPRMPVPADATWVVA